MPSCGAETHLIFSHETIDASNTSTSRTWGPCRPASPKDSVRSELRGPQRARGVPGQHDGRFGRATAAPGGTTRRSSKRNDAPGGSLQPANPVTQAEQTQADDFVPPQLESGASKLDDICPELKDHLRPVATFCPAPKLELIIAHRTFVTNKIEAMPGGSQKTPNTKKYSHYEKSDFSSLSSRRSVPTSGGGLLWDGGATVDGNGECRRCGWWGCDNCSVTDEARSVLL